MGISGATPYFETPDCSVVALGRSDGKEKWHKSICNEGQIHFGSVPPVIVQIRVIVGVHPIWRPSTRRPGRSCGRLTLSRPSQMDQCHTNRMEFSRLWRRPEALCTHSLYGQSDPFVVFFQLSKRIK